MGILLDERNCRRFANDSFGCLYQLEEGEINFEQSLGRKIDSVRKHLSLVYHRYLSGETGITRLTIKINGQKVAPVDPFLLKKSIQVMDDEVLVLARLQQRSLPKCFLHGSSFALSFQSDTLENVEFF